jgi:hypothetical protein
MENTVYSLRINTKEEKYNLVSEILDVSPLDLSRGWILEVENITEKFIDFINQFLDILERKYELLSEIGVLREDISIWMLYGYNNQCNLEFRPQDLKRLGINNISLCISCYEAGNLM